MSVKPTLELYYEATHTIDILREENEALKDRLFALGAMEDAPCFACGYNGTGYYNPEKHSCAEKHLRLYRPICERCDLVLNAPVLKWMGFADWKVKIAKYKGAKGGGS